MANDKKEINEESILRHPLVAHDRRIQTLESCVIDIDKRLCSIEIEIKSQRSEFKSDMKDLKDEFKSDMKQQRDEFRADMQLTRTEFNHKFNVLIGILIPIGVAIVGTLARMAHIV